ncbi:MAG: uL15 family ribosomal protein, partial [Candidatus Aenigmarchaeota archaeon]|nr:uL15 family ribosomal protein [Candidatus Aenigmarchaeota archaeon]
GEIEALAGSKKKIDLGALGYDKVLGAGRISKPLEVIAPVFTKSAAKKIEVAGGKCEGEIPAEKKTAKRTKEAKASKSEDADSEDEEGEGKGSEGEESEEEE